jgi:AcrR family transcriptional regulator
MMTPVSSTRSKTSSPSRTNDPERTMSEILNVATQEFAGKGLAGARIDEIAAATRTSKRMIYYYFGSKEGLYVAVLEAAYGRMRQIEADLHLNDLEPVEALKRLVEFTYDHHQSNEEFIRLVMSENVQRGEYLAQSKEIQKLNGSALQTIQDLYTRGLKKGVFKKNLTPLEIHSAISALTFFNVSNQHTFGLIFKGKTPQGKAQTLKKTQVVDMLMSYVCL